MRSFITTLVLLALFRYGAHAQLQVRDLNIRIDGDDDGQKQETEETSHYKPVMRARFLASTRKSSKKSKTNDSNSDRAKSSKRASSNDNPAPIFTSRRHRD